ncbi:Importin N-terminal domain-containing protein [Mycena kentingensis (nom. inval.)]|nr:Importin N-terminal domain-containing protein [Mycena kentingensis (nom. inval.)]
MELENVDIDASVRDIRDLLRVNAVNGPGVEVNTATEKFNKLHAALSKSMWILALSRIVLDGTETLAVRRMASQEMCARIGEDWGDHWNALPPSYRAELKQAFFEFVLWDENLRSTAVDIVSAVAKIEIRQGTWPELMQHIDDACNSAQVDHREAGLLLMCTIFPDYYRTYHMLPPGLFAILESSLNDAESVDIGIMAVRMLFILTAFLSNPRDEDSFRALVPCVLPVIGVAVAMGNARGILHSLEYLDALLTDLTATRLLVDHHVYDVAQLLVECAADSELGAHFRVQFLEKFFALFDEGIAMVQSTNVGSIILLGLLPIAAEDSLENIVDGSPTFTALRIIRTLATKLPPSQILSPLLQSIPPMIDSRDYRERRGALLALGICIEGCGLSLTPAMMSAMWPFVLASLADNESDNANSACIALYHLCATQAVDCAAQVEAVLPRVLTLLSSPATQRMACIALSALLDVIPEHLDRYLGRVLQGLLPTLAFAPATIKIYAVAAVASAASASIGRGFFLPYLRRTVGRLQHFIKFAHNADEGTGLAFLPWLSKSVNQTLLKLTAYGVPNIQVRQSIVVALVEFPKALHRAGGAGQWTPGLQMCTPLDVRVAEIASLALQTAMECRFEADREIITTICDGVASLVNEIGPGLLAGNSGHLSTFAATILARNHECQSDLIIDMDAMDERFEEGPESETTLIIAALNLVGAMAAAAGPDFASEFLELHPLLAQTCSSTRPWRQRAACMSCLVRSIRGMRDAIVLFAEPVLEMCFHALSSGEASVSSDAALAVGLLLQHADVASVSPQYRLLLEALVPLLAGSDEATNDNRARQSRAAIAVAHLILRDADSALSVKQALPLFIDALPLVRGEAVVGEAIGHLLKTNNEYKNGWSEDDVALAGLKAPSTHPIRTLTSMYPAILKSITIAATLALLAQLGVAAPGPGGPAETDSVSVMPAPVAREGMPQGMPAVKKRHGDYGGNGDHRGQGQNGDPSGSSSAASGSASASASASASM